MDEKQKQRTREVRELAARIYEDRYTYLFRIARRNAATRSDAEEALQEAFAYFIAGYYPDSGAPALAWITTTMKRRCWRLRDGAHLDYRSMLRAHIAKFFGERPVEKVDADRIAAFLGSLRKKDLSTKTISNHLVFLHGLFSFALKRGWVAANPVPAVDRPRAQVVDPDIHYLELDEIEALLRAVAKGDFASADRTVYLVAAMTGLRQGELVALRWSDVDWTAARIRVRRNYTAMPSAPRSPGAARARCRWQTGWPAPSSATSRPPPTKRTQTWSSPIPRPDTRSMPRRYASATRTR